jgi:predicted RNA-binding Zn ribbon-like protein
MRIGRDDPVPLSPLAVTSEPPILVIDMTREFAREEELGPQPGRRAPAPGRLRTLQAFINSNDIEETHDEFASPDRLRHWLRRQGLAQTGTPVSEADRRWTISVREALRDLIDARDAGGESRAAAAVLDAAAKAAGLSLTFGPDGASWTPTRSGARAAVGRILAELPLAVASGDWRRLKTCHNDACRWVFYDASRNRSSRWCSMSICGNRMKARAHRARSRHSRGPARGPDGRVSM